MCYPNYVLIHIRLSGLTDQQVKTLADAPGLRCSDVDEGTVRAQIEIAHDLPTWPDLNALQDMVRTMVTDLVPHAKILDVRGSYRYAFDAASPAEAALHRLRSSAERALKAAPGTDCGELLTAVVRDWRVVDDWLSNGGSLPTDWARRHPAGNHTVAQKIMAGIKEPAAAFAAG